jgi:putative ABC transport system permease protein
MPLQDHLGIIVLDLRYAARDLRRNRRFTVAALLALTLGIGSATAVFSVVDRILFRALPYRNADRLVSFGMVAPIFPQEFMLGYDYFDWREARTPFESVGAWNTSIADCDLNDTRPVRLRCARADSTLLPTLGTALLAGRAFTRDDERPNAPRIALISSGLWRSRFGGDAAPIGKTLRLDGQDVMVAGVLPPEFELPTLDRPDILTPQTLDDPEQRARRATTPLYAVARLRPGVTPAQAQAALRPLFDQALLAVPASFRKDVSLRVRPLRDRQIQDARLGSWVLLGSVLAVLLIACANVANLLLARAAVRERDHAIRMALGAGRGRLMRQALTESAPLALAGGAAGCALAFGLLRVFTAMGPEGIPRLREATVDPRVLLFTIAVSLICGLLFGLAPALQRPRVETLGGGRSAATGGHRLRQVLVAAQIGVSLMLLTGAGLLLRSLWNLENQPLGMRADGTITASVTLSRTSYRDGGKRVAFFESMEERLRRLPGVVEVAVSDSLPPAQTVARTMLYGAIDVQGQPQFADGTGGNVVWRAVTPGYFSLLRIPIRRGRGFDETDRDPNASIVIVSEALARRMFPGQDPLGQRIRPGHRGPWLTVVGVAANVKNGALAEPDLPEFYLPRTHASDTGFSAAAILRSSANPKALAPWVRAELAALDPTLPVTVETMEQQIGKLAEAPRFQALLLGIFASIGLLLAAIGLYGVISFLVAQRRGEIGIRMALGATPRAIRRLMLGQAARWTAAGAAAGAVGSFFTARLIGRMLFHASPKDPWALGAAAAMLFAVALAAAWIPSRRAARMDPTQALRGE